MDEPIPEPTAALPGSVHPPRADFAELLECAQHLAAAQARTGAALDALRAKLRASLDLAEGRVLQREPWVASGVGSGVARGAKAAAAGSAPEST